MDIRVRHNVMMRLSKLNKRSQDAELGHTVNKRIAIHANGVGRPPLIDDDVQKYIGSILVGGD